jgi:hypothetical protein
VGCIIIDANCGGEFNPVAKDAAPILKWLLCGKGVAISGGKLKKELLGCSFKELYQTLVLAGRLFEVDSKRIESEILSIEGKLTSNDAHVIAIARLSDCRLLFSRDKGLQTDFKKKSLIDHPRGKVYSLHTHARLLGECPKSTFQKK